MGCSTATARVHDGPDGDTGGSAKHTAGSWHRLPTETECAGEAAHIASGRPARPVLAERGNWLSGSASAAAGEEEDNGRPLPGWARPEQELEEEDSIDAGSREARTWAAARIAAAAAVAAAEEAGGMNLWGQVVRWDNILELSPQLGRTLASRTWGSWMRRNISTLDTIETAVDQRELIF